MKPTLAVLAVAALAAAATPFVFPATVSAQDGAAAIAARKDVFQENLRAMRAIKPVVDAGSGFAAIVPHAQGIAEGAMKVTAFFPEGSAQGDTKAKPEIWMDRAGFDALFVRLKTHALELATAAEAGDAAAIRAAFQATGQTCSACHDRFRF